MQLRKEAVDIVLNICRKYKNEPSPLMLVLSETQKEYGHDRCKKGCEIEWERNVKDCKRIRSCRYWHAET